MRGGLAMPDLKQYANEQRYNFVYWRRRLRHRGTLPTLSAPDQTIVRRLLDDGGAVTSLKALDIAGTDAMLKSSDALMASLQGRSPVKGGFGVQANPAEIDACPALIRWGLDERLLAIVSNYIGLPVVYRGLTVRRDLAGGDKVETRLFHRDNEDNRIVKIIVYLNDVDEDGGAFEFIPVADSPASWRVKGDGSRASDDAMSRLTSPSRWLSCMGERGTAVFADTCRIYHRGRIAKDIDRVALFFCYNSATPISPQWCQPLFDRNRFIAACPELSPRQRAAISVDY
jgi:hypothetical protein